MLQAYVDLSSHDEPVSMEFLRLALFFISNFPSHYYKDIQFDLLDQFFAAVSKRIGELCGDNESFLQVIFSLFNLYQKTGGLSVKTELIADFVVRRNLNVHYELMSATELISVPLYLSILFASSKQDFISFFDSKILKPLTATLDTLETAQISQLVVLFSNFEYRK